MFVKRTLRVLYGQTQAYPYAATLDPSLRNTDGSFRAPLSTDVTPLARSANAFTWQGGLPAGVVVAKSAGEAMVVHNGNAAVRPFGLLANFVGGTIDDLQDNNEIGVWRGTGSVYELLYPAFDDTGLAAAYAAATPGAPVAMRAGTDGRLTSQGTGPIVGYLIERRNAAVIQVELVI